MRFVGSTTFVKVLFWKKGGWREDYLFVTIANCCDCWGFYSIQFSR